MQGFKEFIHNKGVFCKLTEAQLTQLSQSAILRNYQKSEFIAHCEDIFPYILIVESGVISVMKLSNDGRNLGSLRLQSGDVFASPSFFDGGPLPACLEVKEDCRVYLLHNDQSMPILKQNSEAMHHLCLMLVKRMRQASDFVEELAFQPVYRRLARLLLDQFKGSPDPHITRSFTLDEMSTMIGTTPVMVCKLLSRFASEGFIKVSRTEFELLDYSALEQMTER